MFNDGVHPDSRAVAGGDLERVQRIGARFLGAGLIAYLAVGWPVLVATAGFSASWWAPTSVVTAIGPGLALVVASFRPGTRWLAPLAATASLGYLAALALWAVAWHGVPIPDSNNSGLWLSVFPGMPAMIVALVNSRLAIGALVAGSAGVAVAQQYARFGELNGDLPFEVLWSVAFTGVFLAIVHVAIATGRLLDETRAGAYQSAADAAAAAARSAEQARFDAVIHDRAIATLLAIDTGPPSARLAEQARSALEAMAALASGVVPERDESVPATQVARRLRLAAADFGDHIDIALDLDPDSGRYPMTVVDAFVEAMSEALRNVARHAGADASSAVLCRVGPDSLSMAIVDDGVGFDVAAIGEGRLGVRAGIRGRMALVDGAAANVISHRGRGTTVQLSWVRS